jgi:hypothetical protein
MYQQQLECQKLAVEQLLLVQAERSVRASDTGVYYYTGQAFFHS